VTAIGRRGIVAIKKFLLIKPASRPVLSAKLLDSTNAIAERRSQGSRSEAERPAKPAWP
jgi:hypothetical protein